MVRDKGIAYAGSWYPHHLDGDLKEIKDAGCTSITLTVNESDWERFRRAKKLTVQKAHDLGLEVHVNMHGFASFASYQVGSEYLMLHPEARQVYASGSYVQTSCGCPNDRAHTDWLKETLAHVIEELEPDAMFWDEPAFAAAQNFPEDWACRCGSCKSLFRERYGMEMPATLTDQVKEFRQQSVLDFMTEIISVSKAAGSKMDILCLMCWDRRGGSINPGWYGVTDWEPFLSIPGLDVFSTDPYWINSLTFEYFVDNAADAIRLARKYGKLSQIWVQLVWVPEGKEPEVARTIREAADLGADMIAAWSYKAEPGSDIYRAANPELTWQTLADTYRSLG